MPFAELADERWTSCTTGTDPYTALSQAARRSGVDLAIVYTIADHATQLDLVARGLAVACIPELSLVHDPPGVRILDIQPALTRSVDLVVRSGPQPRHIENGIATLAGSTARHQFEAVRARAAELGVRAEAMQVEYDNTGMAGVAALAGSGQLHPHVSGTYPLAEAAKAHALGETGRVTGKLVLTVRPAA